MKSFLLILVVLASPILLASPLYPQQVEAPVYKDGDWWRVRVEVTHAGSFQRPGLCEEMYGEYLVRIEDGMPQTYATVSGKEKAVQCPQILSQLLDMGAERRALLQFPLKVENSWKFPYRRASPNSGRVSWFAAESKVKSFGKVKTPKGELEAFKIERYAEGALTETYYYSPSVKAIILFDRKTVAVRRLVTLLDYGAGPAARADKG